MTASSVFDHAVAPQMEWAHPGRAEASYDDDRSGDFCEADYGDGAGGENEAHPDDGALEHDNKRMAAADDCKLLACL